MNKQQLDILYSIWEYGGINQRVIAKNSGYSLGNVNQTIRLLSEEGFISEGSITDKTRNLLEKNKPQSAVILAAGYGMRMVPVNMEVPKALIEVNGETLIERHIKHLHEAGITRIYVVAGHLKEQLEFLIDRYNVRLVINSEYNIKNNLSSLYKVFKKYDMNNVYIVPCDVWCRQNPFRKHEMYSWYMVSEEEYGSDVKVNRKQELISASHEEIGNRMVGISYLCSDELENLKRKIDYEAQHEEYDDCFWEDALYDEQHKKMCVYARTVDKDDAVEINTYEQLRELDNESKTLKSDAIEIIADVFNVADNEISDITVLKKGMTNRSFLFSCMGQRYIMRIPGEGTSELINRRQEAAVYQTIKDKGISDEIVYINPDNGYKITRFIDNARVCNADNVSDLKLCMDKLRTFHSMGLKVDHEFDIFGQMEYYETLWNGRPSLYRDYEQTKSNVLKLKNIIDRLPKKHSLTHIDANADNFIISRDEQGKEVASLIDWEYAGMQDPHVDLAMFCIYSMYDREQTDRLIDIYFEGNTQEDVRTKIYCYIAVCGLLWSNWCEYKSIQGVEFGEYSLAQYRYAKEYYRIVEEKENEKR